jgi:hypothetical protein
LEQFLDLLDDVHAAFLSGRFAPPNENFPEEHFLSPTSDVFGIL